MNDIMKIITKFQSDDLDWSDFNEFLQLSNREIEEFYKFSYNLKIKNFGKDLKVYVPNIRFPAISITGTNCSLECSHCNKKYLDGMEPILTNKDLKNFLTDLSNKGGVGALVSGGCEFDGSVPLLNFLDTIKEVKEETNLIINAHTGLLNEETAKKLADSQVDIISFDINVDKEIINNIYKLDKTIEDYKLAIELLKKYDLNIVPHICVGLHYGKIHKELESLKFIKALNINPSLIVIIALITPKDTDVYFEQLDPLDIGKIIAVTRTLFPKTELSLGCMRPRGNIKVEVEKHAIKAGITRIEIPSRKTLKWLRKFEPHGALKFYSACCAIPSEFESVAISDPSDIRSYQL